MVADRLGLASVIARAFEHDVPSERRRYVMRRAAAERRFADAAEIAADLGDVSPAANLHVAAAEALLQESHRDEARAQLERALTFYRSVGATRFIREAEELLASIEHRPDDATAPPV